MRLLTTSTPWNASTLTAPANAPLAAVWIGDWLRNSAGTTCGARSVAGGSGHGAPAAAKRG